MVLGRNLGRSQRSLPHAESDARGSKHLTPTYCSFCGKSDKHDHVRVVAGPTVFICEECVGLCADILREQDEARRAASKDETA